VELLDGPGRGPLAALTGDLHVLTGWASARGVELDGLQLERGSFEDTYLELIGAGEGRG
jgi:hypothetical protein